MDPNMAELNFLERSSAVFTSGKDATFGNFLIVGV